MGPSAKPCQYMHSVLTATLTYFCFAASAAFFLRVSPTEAVRHRVIRCVAHSFEKFVAGPALSETHCIRQSEINVGFARRSSSGFPVRVRIILIAEESARDRSTCAHGILSL